MLTVGSLFSGIGGLDLGLEQAGLQTIWQVEFDDWCRERLAENFPHTKKYKDVKEVGKHNLQPVDVICGGFPCQDVSVANQIDSKGLGGERSGLWSEYFRIIRELRPNYALIENVAKLSLSGLNRVLADLASIGFDAEWQTLRAETFGLPQVRERLFIIAYAQSKRFFLREVYGSASYQAGTKSKIQRHPPITHIDAIGRSFIEIPEHLRMDNGVSFELSEIERAVKGYGNAVAVPVAKWLGEQIIRFDKEINFQTS